MDFSQTWFSTFPTVQSSYNFTNSRVATHFHAWLHAKSCRVPRLVAACPTPRPCMVTRKELPCATLSSCVSHAMSMHGYTQKAACAMLNSCVSHVYGCSRMVLATRLHLRITTCLILCEFVSHSYSGDC